MLTKMNTDKAYKLVNDRLAEYERVASFNLITNKKTSATYEHLLSMFDYLTDSISIGAEEVLLNIAEVDSLVREIIVEE